MKKIYCFIFEGRKYFLIIFQEYGNYWILGKPFLRKYQFVMNYDSKTIGFYKFQNINYKNDTNNTIDKNKTCGAHI